MAPGSTGAAHLAPLSLRADAAGVLGNGGPADDGHPLMPGGWGPAQKKMQAARNKAVDRLIALYPSDFLKLYDEERGAVGLAPLREQARRQVAPGCGVYNHARGCTCDLIERTPKRWRMNP